jgi:hypothetical protein
MDVALARINRGAQVADVVARVMAETVEIWVGTCLEVVIDHDELLRFLQRPQWHYVTFEPIRFHHYPGRMSGVSIGSRHHALADLDPLRGALLAAREARR